MKQKRFWDFLDSFYLFFMGKSNTFFWIAQIFEQSFSELHNWFNYWKIDTNSLIINTQKVSSKKRYQKIAAISKIIPNIDGSNQLRVTNDELRMTNDEWRVTSYELRNIPYKLRMTYYEWRNIPYIKTYMGTRLCTFAYFYLFATYCLWV